MTDSEDNPVSLPVQKRIVDHVEANPGIHFSQLKRDLDLETGTLQYHLRELEGYDVLESESHQGKRRVFVAQELSEDEKAILSMLRYETTRRILLHLLEAGESRNGEVATALGVSRATVSWHLSNLEAEGVVAATDDGRATLYEVTDEELVVQLLVRYQESFVDRAVDRLIDFWG